MLLTIKWETMHDNKVCKICQALEGYVWTLEVGKDPFPQTLTHPIIGPVWNVAAGSGVHGDDPLSCRCRLIPQYDLSDLVAKLSRIAEELDVPKDYVTGK
jgi:hypothetical protein